MGEEFEDLNIYVTEWNSSGNTGSLERGEDYGLFQAHEMLNIMEQFLESGVDTAHAWPLLQNTANTFSEGFVHEALTPAGHMFQLMASSLPGKVTLDFAGPESEASFQDVDVHAFYGDGELVFFIASTADGIALTDIDISGLIAGFETATAEVLGVEAGHNPGDTSSPAEIDTLVLSDFYDDGFLTAVLDQGEIMRITLTGIVPTAEFSVVTQGIDDLDYEGEVEAADAHDKGDVPSERPAEEAAPEQADDVRGGADKDLLGGYYQIRGGDGDDLLEAGDGSETLHGGDGADVLRGSYGDDLLEGAGGDDAIDGGSGNDSLIGGDGNDRAWGADGDDRLWGASGDDVLDGGAGNDILVGNSGQDTVRGGDGNDRLEGLDGQDHLYGGRGNDTLDGGRDADWIHAGAGRNLVTAGDGRDTIAFDDDSEDFVTRISDFNLGEDRISITAEDVESLSDLTIVRSPSAEQIILMLSGDPNRQIILEGDFGDEDLEEDDFDFL